MSDSIVNHNHPTKTHRPLGVWILTIYALLFATLIVFDDSFFVLKGEAAMYASAEVPAILRWAYLNIGIIIASIIAWAGWELGRKLFLFLISIFYWAQAGGLYLRIIHPYFGKNPMEYKINSWLHFIGYILIPMLYIWYFNQPSTREFYRETRRVFIK